MTRVPRPQNELADEGTVDSLDQTGFIHIPVTQCQACIVIKHFKIELYFTLSQHSCILIVFVLQKQKTKKNKNQANKGNT